MTSYVHFQGPTFSLDPGHKTIESIGPLASTNTDIIRRNQ